jgi:hypothetical protein
LAPTALLRPTALIIYSNPHGMPEVGLPALLLIGMTVVWVAVTWQKLANQQRLSISFAGVALILALLATTTLAHDFWRLLPPVGLLQFPFRWLGPAWLMAALWVSALALPVKEASTRRLWLVLLAVLLVWYVVAGLRNLPLAPAMLRSLGVAQVSEEAINLAGLRAFEYDQADNLRDGCWVWAYEYVPRTSALSDCAAMRDLILHNQPVQTGLPPVTAQVQPSLLAPNRLAAQISATEPWTLTLHSFWLPGWQATVAGRPVESQAIGPLGLVGVSVPAGEHLITLGYGPTVVRRVMMAVAGIALFVWLGLAFWRQRGLALGVCSAIVVLGGVPAWVATQAPALQPLQAVQVEFAGQLALTGFAFEVVEDQLALDLVWLARQESTDSYKVFVHLIDDTGKLWAQADARPVGYGSNTNRWPAGGLVLDRHRLPLPADLPAGSYQVRVGLYHEDTGKRLPVVDAAGQATDDQVLIGYVETP